MERIRLGTGVRTNSASYGRPVNVWKDVIRSISEPLSQLQFYCSWRSIACPPAFEPIPSTACDSSRRGPYLEAVHGERIISFRSLCLWLRRYRLKFAGSWPCRWGRCTFAGLKMTGAVRAE